jgi:predicted N-acetyltransferase YhbS
MGADRREGSGAQALLPLYRIEPLHDGHDRTTFQCGKDPLDRFIQHQVFDWVRRGLAQPFVLVSTDEPARVLGYYTLSMTRIDASDLPHTLAKKFPKSAEIGAVLLGKLAVLSSHQGRKLGRDLLFDALDRAADANRQVASYAVVVDAIDDEAACFYRRHGFEAFPDTPFRLFLPIRTHIERVAKATLRNRP